MVPARPRVYQFGIPQVPATYSYYPDTAKFIILYDLSYLFSGLGRENRATSKAWIAMYTCPREPMHVQQPAAGKAESRLLGTTESALLSLSNS